MTEKVSEWELGKMNTAIRSMKVKPENSPRHSLTEILTEILIVLSEELMDISVCKSTKELTVEQVSK